ncbi:MAG: MoxR family ATPase [Thermodesulfobacteriota bacterium]
MDINSQTEKINKLRANLEKILRGKTEIIDLVITSLVSRGHLLIEDVPGVGKTTLAHGLARSINLSFQRIQFTSDLLPSDVIGVTIYNQATSAFEFKAGPIFANVILADEINRATPKTQSALLEAMNDRQVTVERVTHKLPEPFIILATQNPLEYSGTFPLPESQLDRFAIRVKIGYPDTDTEKNIVTADLESLNPDNLSPVLSTEDVLELQRTATKVTVDDSILDYAVRIVAKTREHPGVKLGVSPRGSMVLYAAARALALVEGRDFVTPDDIKRLSVPVLSHRLQAKRSIEGSGETIDTDLIVDEILSETTVPI